MDDHTILSEVEHFGTVSVCPGGVVHVHLVHVSLKFLPEDFLKFCDLMTKARRQYDPPRVGAGKPRLQLVTPEDKSQPDCVDGDDS